MHFIMISCGGTCFPFIEDNTECINLFGSFEEEKKDAVVFLTSNKQSIGVEAL